MSVALIGAKLGSYLPFLLLTISILLGVPVAYRYYREVREDDDPIRNSDLLADLEQGDAASKMTEAEFRRVRELLVSSKTNPDAKTRAKPAGPRSEKAAARLIQEESSRGELPSHGEDERANQTEIDGKQEPSG
jgi:hypothetical protein